MDQVTFRLELVAAGYDDVEDKDLGPRPANAEHAHDHDIRGLVLNGIFTVRQRACVERYHAGEIFEVSAGVKHSEEIGPDGAKVIIGRRSSRPR